jgi:DNA modification methylase
MIADAVLDCTHHGDVVIDCFLGSGTTLIAADRTGRCCYGMELDPLYADLAIRRWQNWTGEQAVELASGRTFGELEQTNCDEEATSDER